MAKVLLAMFPPHHCYVEPFAGCAALLFMREPAADVEILNDLDGEIVNFFRVVKHHPGELCEQLRWVVPSRAVFDLWKDLPLDGLTDIQRAARFYYLQGLSFGAKNTGRIFGTSAVRKPRLNMLRMDGDIAAAHARLQRVTVERLPWRDCMQRYDRPDTFFYIDPPYWRVQKYAVGRLTLADYWELAEIMSALAGKAILSINDHPEMRRAFGGLHLVRRYALRYSIGGPTRAKAVGELAYRNWRQS